jgi:hypothetical protein
LELSAHADATLIYQHASRQVSQTDRRKISALIEGIGSTVKDLNDGEEDGPSSALVPAGRQHASKYR